MDDETSGITFQMKFTGGIDVRLYNQRLLQRQ